MMLDLIDALREACQITTTLHRDHVLARNTEFLRFRGGYDPVIVLGNSPDLVVHLHVKSS